VRQWSSFLSLRTDDPTGGVGCTCAESLHVMVGPGVYLRGPTSHVKKAPTVTPVDVLGDDEVPSNPNSLGLEVYTPVVTLDLSCARSRRCWRSPPACTSASACPQVTSLTQLSWGE
jgi:hypothetical protein